MVFLVVVAVCVALILLAVLSVLFYWSMRRVAQNGPSRYWSMRKSADEELPRGDYHNRPIRTVPRRPSR